MNELELELYLALRWAMKELEYFGIDYAPGTAALARAEAADRARAEYETTMENLQQTHERAIAGQFAPNEIEIPAEPPCAPG